MSLLNLGCGGAKAEGWTNVDVWAIDKPDVAGDGMNLPFRSGVFSAAYVAHVIEYVEPDFVTAILREVRRVLVPGKRAVVVIPSFHRVSKAKLGPEEFHEAVYGASRHPGDVQLWLPSEGAVAEAMTKAGFVEVESVPRHALGRGWPNYKPKPWEGAIRGYAPRRGPVSHDGAGPATQEASPVALATDTALDELISSKKLDTVSHSIRGGKYRATVRKGKQIGEGEGSSLVEAVEDAITNLSVEKDADKGSQS